jgi:UDP-glucose 4-epimerase
MIMMNLLITGGAGFIGSSLCEEIMNHKWKVSILDNFSSSSKSNIQHLLENNSRKVRLLIGDCTKASDLDGALKDVDVVFHFAANPEVRLELTDSKTCFRQNVYATYILLEVMKNCDAKKVVFASTSTVYGDAKVIPTPEDYGPLEPISIYGAAKLSSEALIMAYAHTYGFDALILRLANIVGPRSKHGVTFDFAKKLQENPRELEILGDGTQSKSYLYIDDCVSAVLGAFTSIQGGVEILNVGSEDQITVREIAEIVVEEMKLKNVHFHFTGGIDCGRGWIGDVKNMLLDITKLRAKGWKPKYNSREAIRQTAKSIAKDFLAHS